MLTRTLPLALVASFLLVACGDKDTDNPVDDTDDTTDDTDDTEDTTDDTGPVADASITAVSYSYTQTQWQYGVTTGGTARLALVEAHSEMGEMVLHENHRLELKETTQDPITQAWGITLPIVTDPAEQEDGRTTLFMGQPQAEEQMTWMATITDPTGPIDCVVWGARPAVYADYECRPIEADSGGAPTK
jgi:hypothetical protein